MLRIVVIVSLVLLVSLSPPAQATQQANAIPKNQIVKKLECLNDSSQSYALYLPSNYTPDRKWPILYALDPGARGKTPVERFKEAAEKYGWILAGSNNSRNGPWRRAADAWSAMTKDTQQRFSIDDDRVYATGFSGGARVALQIAQLCQDCLAGVIASGAGFPAGLAPSTSMHFFSLAPPVSMTSIFRVEKSRCSAYESRHQRKDCQRNQNVSKRRTERPRLLARVNIYR